MRTTTALTALAATAAGLLVGLAGPASAGETTVTRERGIVIECTGSRAGLDVHTSLYENNRHGQYLEVTLDDDPATSANTQPRGRFLRDGRVRARSVVAGEPVVIRGTATIAQRRTPVSESIDDAGVRVETEGTHRRIRARLVLRTQGVRVPLSCGEAFAYDLTVTRTPIV